jgi:hypothetical protein
LRTGDDSEIEPEMDKELAEVIDEAILRMTKQVKLDPNPNNSGHCSQTVVNLSYAKKELEKLCLDTETYSAIKKMVGQVLALPDFTKCMHCSQSALNLVRGLAVREELRPARKERAKIKATA